MGGRVSAALALRGSATAVYEALAAGLPVICTENTGSVVRHGLDGYIVPVRDVRETAEILRQLAGNPAMLARMSESARERASEFTVSRYGERLMAALSRHRAFPAKYETVCRKCGKTKRMERAA